MALKYKCETCGEYRSMALMREKDICHNCANREPSIPLNRCPICNKRNVPSHFHHIAGKTFSKTLGVQICLSCHAIITYQHQRWTNVSRSVAIIQGICDVLKLTFNSYHLSGSTPVDCIEDAKFILLFHKHLLMRVIPELLYSIGFRK